MDKRKIIELPEIVMMNCEAAAAAFIAFADNKSAKAIKIHLIISSF